ncbi:hypothetical protein AAG570_004358 [Ranatra chinensis]|uniref:Uncharacterized protein n=1 Tax=Ranatra chinensis TaxID=642074 RepID=A0ABD0Y250_9HEMI
MAGVYNGSGGSGVAGGGSVDGGGGSGGGPGGGHGVSTAAPGDPDDSSAVSPVTLAADWSRVARLLLVAGLAVVGSLGNVYMISAVMIEDHLKKRGNLPRPSKYCYVRRKPTSETPHIKLYLMSLSTSLKLQDLYDIQGISNYNFLILLSPVWFPFRTSFLWTPSSTVRK